MYDYPDLSMTSTEPESKTDGSLLDVNIVNGISERMYPNEPLDVSLDRYGPSDYNMIIITGVIEAAVILAAVVLFIRHSV